MDNRIPAVVKEFDNGSSARDVLSFLSFEDWLSKKENDAKDWIIVARVWRDIATDLFTFSVVAETNQDSIQNILSQYKWDVDVRFGKPIFGGDEHSIEYDPNERHEINGVIFRPFTIHRSFFGYTPAFFEVIQSFILYHEAFYVSERAEYQRVTHDGEIETVLRIKQEGKNQYILVDSHCLKDYLAATKCYLVRYHDHKRWAEDDIEPYIGGQFAKYRGGDAKSLFEFWLRTDIPREGFKSSSRLLGKDIVLPYEQPCQYHVGLKDEKFVSYIIGRDDQGIEIEATCDENKLSNYFTDRGTPHFLTPVFFSRDSLVKYYQEPRIYSVKSSSLSCLSLWDIPIDITEEGLVQVWLGDLGRIPYKEQLHWRQFNVEPKGTITQHRWLRDFMAEFADPVDDPVYYFHIAFEEIQADSTKKYGRPIFLTLDEKDKHTYQTLHLPITDEWKEFDEQIQALAKISIDSLNVELISALSGAKIDGNKIKGSLALLEMLISQKSVSESDLQKILFPLHAIQTIRSSGAAHRKGENFDKALERFDLQQLTNHLKIKKLVSELTNALVVLRKILEQ